MSEGFGGFGVTKFLCAVAIPPTVDHYGLQVFEDAMVQLLVLTAREERFRLRCECNRLHLATPLTHREKASAAGHHPDFKSL